MKKSLTPRGKPITLEAIFASTIVDENNCFNWTKYLNGGYGRIYVNGRDVYLHRQVLIMHTGIEPDGMFALHSCDNRKCVNPEHLRWGTNADNIADKVLRKRGQRMAGEANPAAKLNKIVADEIRTCYITQKNISALARAYDVSRPTIIDIVNGKRWL